MHDGHDRLYGGQIAPAAAGRSGAVSGDVMEKLDLIDRKILVELMRDATQPVAADRRARRPVADPVLEAHPAARGARASSTGRVAIVDPARIGLGLTVFVGIEAPDHGTRWREAFAATVRDIPEIIEVFRMAGDLDYLLRAAVPDMARLRRALPPPDRGDPDQERHLPLRHGADQGDDRLSPRHPDPLTKPLEPGPAGA